MADPLTEMIAQSLFRINPSLRRMGFDPQGTGFDYDTAIDAGMAPGPDNHWGSRVELSNAIAQTLGLPQGSGIMLKGATHPTWGKALAGEEAAGFNVIQGTDGRYYSVPKGQKSDAWHQMQNQMTANAAMAGLPSVQPLPGEPSPARARTLDAISRLESIGIPVRHFIGTPTEPTGDRSGTMDVEELVKGLRVLEQQALNARDLDALAKISAERAFWEQEVSEGMSAAEWKAQTGEEDPIYPAQ